MKLVCLNTELAGKEFVVTSDRFIIGRSPECDVTFDQGSVSRNHAQVALEKGRYIIRDLKSLNGVQVGGKKVDESPIGPGQIVSVGDVQVQIVFDAPPMPASGTQTLPSDSTDTPASPDAPASADAAQGPDVPGNLPAPVAAAGTPGPSVQDLFQAAPQAPPEPQAQAEARPAAGAGISAWAYGMFALAVLALAAAYILLPQAGGSSQTYSFHVKMKRNEQRAIFMPQLYQADSISLSEEGIVKVQGLSPRILVIEALAAGAVDVRLRQRRGQAMTVKVIIRGAIPDPDEDMEFRQIRDEQRLESARENVVRAEALQQRTRLYQAIGLYRKALALLKPLPMKPPVYHQAREQLKQTEKELEDKWKDLRFQYTQLIETQDLERAKATLMLMRDLIPDEKDWRRQVVELYLQELDKEIDRQERKR